MSDLLIVIALAVVAAVLAGVELARTKGQDLLSWAVLLLALAAIIDRL